MVGDHFVSDWAGATVDNQRLVFRSSFWKVWRCTTIFCSAIGAIIYGLGVLSGFPPAPFPTAERSLGLAILFAIAIALFPVYVSPDGLKCYNFWGIYCFAPWPSIIETKPGNVFGLKYLRVRSSSFSSEMWVPLYLSRMSDFVVAVRESAGESNPLVVALQEHVELLARRTTG
jgi:hypothetical protein